MPLGTCMPAGYRTRSILAIPILSEDNSRVVGVIQMINKAGVL